MATPKTTFVYERKATLFVLTHSQTTIGIWIAVNPCTVLPLDSPVPVIGDTVLGHLSASEVGISHPAGDERRRMIEPFLKAAKVKSWSAFGNSARCVDVSVDKGITKVTPMRNDHPGFFWIEEAAIALPDNVNAEELGAAVLRALERAE